ncbi:endonuclease/exonuclease/phosphatase family protein [Luteolibacter yonseiensis]|uniref:Endonuclease/exonuclease/phosphatase family protein n=1 Tax=Luteolibacter yonseiensis TaxID=1144680 RepID=A0A934VDN4_9BACT|nr:endonuclease/exonuclease/phosphatase family protein [Luteolibacter yonseiensis]MBK1818315.1 endonuclease/exonuclease/phosphatase family protein [Luteolibacter yonseiensis]
MSTFCRFLGWLVVGLSLVLHLFTVYTFALQPDRFAAFTVMPIWLWGGFGMLLCLGAFYFLRARFSLLMAGVWAVTLLVGADEAHALLNIGKPPPLPGRAAPYEGSPTLRVVTLNCSTFIYGNPAADLAVWQPDIVLLQEVEPHLARQIADTLYGGRGDLRFHAGNAIVTRWRITRDLPNTDRNRRALQVTVRTPGGQEMEVVNIHLPSASTDLRLWRKYAWSAHRVNRATRLAELAVTRRFLAGSTHFPHKATILGGDFNAPASDIVHRTLAPDLVDAFGAAGTGWGNTFQRRLPILRIDHIYATRHFVPVRSRVVATRNSDHRMVIADFLAPTRRSH